MKTRYDKNDQFPFAPHQDVTVFQVIVARPNYVAQLVEADELKLTWKATQTLRAFLKQPIGKQTGDPYAMQGNVEVSGMVERETDLAVYFHNERTKAWVPKQFFHRDDSRSVGNVDVVAFIPKWLAVREGFV